MKYSCVIEEKDLLELNKYNFKHIPSVKRRMLAIRILFAVVVLATASLMERSMDYSGSPFVYVHYGIALAFALAFFLSYKQLIFFSVKRRIRKNKESGKSLFGSELTYEFLEDSYKETTRDSESTVKYSIIRKVSTGKNAYYLYVSDRAAHILPFRVFASDSEREEFYRFIQSKVTDEPGQK